MVTSAEIELVKQVRSLTGCGLHEARDMVAKLRELTKADMRDHFAGLSMQGILSNQEATKYLRGLTAKEASKEVAKQAYADADAMLEARNAS